MIKFCAETDKGPLIGLGLSKQNLAQLYKGRPIHLPLDQFGIPGKSILLFSGETEEAMMKELIDAGLVRPDTKINKEGS